MPKIRFEWQRAASESAKKGWETRWEKAATYGLPVGPKGEAYLEKKYGPEVGGERYTGGPSGAHGGGRGPIYVPPEYIDDFPEENDFDFYDWDHSP